MNIRDAETGDSIQLTKAIWSAKAGRVEFGVIACSLLF